MNAKDYFGNEIEVGDTVAFMQRGYRDLMTGTIKSISEKMLVISHGKSYVGGDETRQFHNQVIKKLNAPLV